MGKTTFLLLLSFFSTIGCSNDGISLDSSSKIISQISAIPESVGQMHNDLLHRFEQAVLVGGAAFSSFMASR